MNYQSVKTSKMLVNDLFLYVIQIRNMALFDPVEIQYFSIDLPYMWN